MVSLLRLLDGIKTENVQDIKIKGITCDSREVKEGDVFVAIKGEKDDGHNHVLEAEMLGAQVIIAEHETDSNLKTIIVPDTRKAYGKMCSNFFDNPEKDLKIVTIVGTNGKTTTSYIIEHLLKSVGYKTGVIGTLGYKIIDERHELDMTTPQSFTLFKILRKMVGELEFSSRFLRSNLIAVTGTNGKTTVTLMINDGLNRAGLMSYAVGNIGIPLSEKVQELTESDIAVCEVSSFQLESIKDFCPDIAVLTNVTKDHLTRHKNEEKYIEIKSRIFKNQMEKDIAILNYDDENSLKISDGVNADKYYFSTKQRVRGAYLDGDDIIFEDDKKMRIMSIGELSLKQRFNVENSLCSAIALIKSGVNPEIVRATLKGFIAPMYRMTYLGERRGKKVYNDSKATNISSTLASASSLSGNTILIVGGRKKGENYADLFKNMPKNVTHIFVTGENSVEIMGSATNLGYYNITKRDSLKECYLESLLTKSNNILFSPASSSFDNYQNFEDRGRAFDELFLTVE